MGALGTLAVVLVGVLALRSFVAEVRTVTSESMAPTLRHGQRVLVVKAGVDRWALQPGDIVAFDAADLWADRSDPAGTVFVKRVVGVGGDRITCCDDQGRILRNGVPVAEPYLAGARTDQVRFDVEVRSGHYWLLGDDRSGSADSRAHLGGPGGGNVPASRIIGSVRAVVWPPGSLRRVEAADEPVG